MKQISLFIVLTLCIGCSNSTNNNAIPFLNFSNDGECPEGHRDSIIPVLYGMPTEESFIDADSGKVWLGGCEIPDQEDNWYCKKHQIQF